MPARQYEFNEELLGIINELGGHMPGGFFIYKADAPEELIYANKEVFNIYGCRDIDEFKALTGYTFKGMVHPGDYQRITASIEKQIAESDDKMDYAEYRIIRRDGSIRWVDDYGHYMDTDAFGGIYTVFISDITEIKAERETDTAVRNAVISTLTNAYNTLWLIDDVAAGSISLYHSDMAAIHQEAIDNALAHDNYTDMIEEYIDTMVAEDDRVSMRTETSLPYILEQFRSRDQFSVNFVRRIKGSSGSADDHESSRHYRIDYGKVSMPGGIIGSTMGFKDVDEEVRRSQELQAAIEEARLAEEENRRLAEEVQSAAKLADLMASVSSLLTNMPAMSFSKDVETRRYLACNQAFAEYAGKSSPDEVVGLTDHEIFDKETADHFVMDDTKAIEMDQAYVFFEDVPDATGNDFRNLQTTKSTFRDASGRMCLLGMCVDVTEMTRIKTAEAEANARQHELEEKLALQEELLEKEKKQNELDSMITAMASDYRSVYHVDLDKDDAVCYRSDPHDPYQSPEGIHFPYHERFIEYGKRYVDKNYLDGFLEYIDPDNVRKTLSGESISVYRYLARRDGREYYEMLRMAGVRHPGDRPDHMVHKVGLGFTVIDAEMRESMARSQALAQALETAEEASKAKTSFLSNMSHEIRTPMNAIIGLNNIALSDDSISESTREYLEKIGTSAHHLLNIINDILDMSRIESGRMVINNEEFSLEEALEQVNTIISGQCRDKGLSYDFSIIGTVESHYIGDDVKLRQIMINILGNAVKFTPSGGTISFTVEETTRFKEKSTLRFTISDTGVGMSEEFLPKLFNAFTQENAAKASRYGSTGLGMPITKNIVELMNGNIDVKSEKGRGTTFTVTVTLARSEAASGDIRQKSLAGGSSGRKAENRSSEDLSGRRILLAEDMTVNAEIIMLILSMRQIEVELAVNGRIAAEMFASHDAGYYDAILMDIRMPEMDGLEAARAIRSLERDDAKTIPIVALTANAFAEDVERSMQAGMDAHLSKPVEPDALFTTLSNLI